MKNGKRLNEMILDDCLNRDSKIWDKHVEDTVINGESWVMIAVDKSGTVKFRRSDRYEKEKK